jgi:hypothetical protein
MSPTLEVSCTHERRPGTAACLYCRRERRLAARARHHRFIAWTGTGALGLAIVAMAGVSGMAAFTGWQPPAWIRKTASAMMTVQSSGGGSHLMLVSGPTAASIVPAPTVASVSSSILAPAASTAAPMARTLIPPLLPIVSQGTTLLRDSLIAVRMGNSVTLHFDTPAERTRRPEKFEQIVRSTLPAIYGPAVDSLLAKIPDGQLARAGDLMNDLPTRGLRLALGEGWVLAVWPETRIGHDGPLVVTYRTTVMR